jgi:antitoxin component YwqK of YwqJK toxin-antitoxin module
MYLMTSRAGWRRNNWHNISNGTYTIKEKSRTSEYIIKGGVIVGRIQRYKDATKQRKSIVGRCMYDKFFRSTVNGKLEMYIPYSHNQVQHGESKAKIKIFGEEGTLYVKKYQGRFRQERFVYKNGKTAYTLKYGSNKGTIQIFRPCGKLWAEYSGDIQLGYRAASTSVFSNREQIKGSKVIYNIARHWSPTALTVTEYDKRGKVKHKVQFTRGQKDGILVENYKKTHYVQGVVVSEKLYHATPEQMDAREVMAIENVQVRSAYIKKMGMERVYQQLGGEIIDRDIENDYDLISIDAKQFSGNKQDDNSRDMVTQGDTIIKLLKVKCPSTGVYYTLRVPPDINTVERARQWTFGVNEARDSIELFEKNKITFTKET